MHERVLVGSWRLGYCYSEYSPEEELGTGALVAVGARERKLEQNRQRSHALRQPGLHNTAQHSTAQHSTH